MVPAIERAFTESDAVLIEEFIEGREFGCGVWITADGIRALPVTEIKSHKEFFDYEAKYTAGMSDEITPAEIPAAATVRIQRLAEAAAKACNCRGIVRVDFIMTPTGDIYMVEINSVPGMSGGSIVPKQIAAAGLNMTEVINAVIEDTLCRR
jgi:D-alanine-D-alanine ligase